MPANPLKVSLGAALSQALERKTSNRRNGYIYNVGLDFGTAFTKCVVRDVANATAWPLPLGGSATFLLPSQLCLARGMVAAPTEAGFDGEPVPYLKMALAATVEPVANEAWWRAVHRPVSMLVGEVVAHDFHTLAVYYLSRILGVARRFILQQKPDFGARHDDRCFVNMGIPVAQVGSRRVQDVFKRALTCAYHFAFGDGLASAGLTPLGAAVRSAQITPETEEFCYLYPEVSANVQSYIRSPAAQAKLHLFVDVGAGTVDLSAFIWNPTSQEDRPLTYLAADVFPLGASQIELRAAERSHLPVSVLRACKEGAFIASNDLHFATRCLYEARASIKEDLCRQSERILQKTRDLIPTAKRDRHRGSQFYQLRLLEGGGGISEPLYGMGVRTALRAVGIVDPSTIHLPMPEDLRWPLGMSAAAKDDAYRRLTVAYGLSFLRADLSDQWLPEEIEPVDSQDDHPRRIFAPTKEEC